MYIAHLPCVEGVFEDVLLKQSVFCLSLAFFSIGEIHHTKKELNQTSISWESLS